MKEAFFRTSRCSLFLGDAEEVLKDFEDASIDCVVTSPPYYRSRRYRTVHLREIGQEKTVDDYVQRLANTGREIFRILRPRGSFWLVLGDTRFANNWLGVPWRVAFAMRDIGWKIRNEVIWHESKHVLTGARDRLGSAHEQVFHFVKNRSAYYDMGAFRKGVAPTDVWTINLEARKHPDFHFSVLPEGLVERTVAATCPPHGVVLDPFLGSGTTAAVALRLGRSAVGIDISRDYLEIARKHISKIP